MLKYEIGDIIEIHVNNNYRDSRMYLEKGSWVQYSIRDKRMMDGIVEYYMQKYQDRFWSPTWISERHMRMQNWTVRYSEEHYRKKLMDIIKEGEK